jgi:hypothetical protein
MEIVIRVILFSLLINWVVALQMLNQFSYEKKTKIISVGLSLILAGIAGLAFLL